MANGYNVKQSAYGEITGSWNKQIDKYRAWKKHKIQTRYALPQKNKSVFL